MAQHLVKEGNDYAAAFRMLSERAVRHEPSWLQRAREDAFTRFERGGFPTVHDEDWKYTNVASIGKSQFTPAVVAGPPPIESGALESFAHEEARGSRLVFVNGIYQRRLSSIEALPTFVRVLDLGESGELGHCESIVREHFERDKSEPNDGFLDLNTALFSGGLLLVIPKGLTVPPPIDLQFISTSSNGHGPAAFPRVLIVAEQNSAATIIESYASAHGGAYFTNAVIELTLDAGARLKHFKVQRESNGAFHIASTKVELGPNANYESTTVNLGAAISRHGIDVMMDHEGAECRVDGLYMVDGNQHTDTHSMIDHRQPHCSSQQLYKGILDGKSHAVFNGKVFVRHGAQQTVAHQTNKNLLLSNEARVDTKPQLEIFADDVKCAHGAAVGQLEADEIFYLESRGIRPDLARNLLTYGFAEEVIEQIKIDSIRRELDAVVLNRLHAELET